MNEYRHLFRKNIYYGNVNKFICDVLKRWKENKCQNIRNKFFLFILNMAKYQGRIKSDYHIYTLQSDQSDLKSMISTISGTAVF